MAAKLHIQRKTWIMSVGALMLFVVLFMSPDKAKADTLLNWSGSPGPSRLSEDPGAVCTRNSNATNGAIAVKAPQVWAHSNYTSGQNVAYRVQLFRNDSSVWSGGYKSIATSSGYIRSAYPNARANFPNTTFNVSPTGYAMEYVAVVHIYWYNQYGQVSGTTSREVDVYYQGTSGQYQYQSCRI